VKISDLDRKQHKTRIILIKALFKIFDPSAWKTSNILGNKTLHDKLLSQTKFSSNFLLELELNICSSWQYWREHYEWTIITNRIPLNTCAHSRVNACSTWKHKTSQQRWIIVISTSITKTKSRNLFSDWVCFRMNAWSTWKHWKLYQK
jgi:hypothetical protein